MLGIRPGEEVVAGAVVAGAVVAGAVVTGEGRNPDPHQNMSPPLPMRKSRNTMNTKN